MACANDENIPSCTPDTLCNLSTVKVARMILRSAVPAGLRHYTPHFTFPDTVDPYTIKRFPCCCHNEEKSREKVRLYCPGADHLILAEEGVVGENLLEAKHVLLDNLRCLAKWWRSETWFGTFDSLVRDRMRRACYHQLQMNESSLSPLLLLTLELLLCHESGYIQMNRMRKDIIDARFCFIYCNFLSELQPFGISRLYASHLKFELGFVISVICSFSPLLTFLYITPELMIKDCLGEIGRTLPKLETFIVPVKQYEVRNSMWSGISLVTDGGEKLEMQLYPTFFGGLQKQAVQHKIENGEMDSVPISFPKLRNIDIGIHKDVIKIIHYLLHIYPNIESICCNQVGWKFSKYSLHYPNVSPSTLGSGPPVFQGSRSPLHLQNMSFSSICLMSRLKEIMERYKSLKHIDLLLLKGPWKIPVISKMAQELVEGQRDCHCLSVCINVYMSREELINLYYLPMNSLSSSLTILQFHLTNEVSAAAIREMINWCPLLRELAVVSCQERCEVAEPYSWEEKTSLNALHKLEALGIYSEYHVSPDLYLLFLEILEVAPNVTVLDLEFGGNQFSKWLLDAAACGKFTKIEILRLHLVPRNPDLTKGNLKETFIDSLFQPLISKCPRLFELILCDVCEYFIHRLRRLYWGSSLQIIYSEMPLVAFRMLASRSC